MIISLKGHTIIIDEEDYPLFESMKWRILKRPNSHTFYLQSIKTWLYFHRLVMGLKIGDKIRVDHRNQNGLDNRKENLRRATIQQNAMNSMKVVGKMYGESITSSGFKGVSYYRRDKNFSAYIHAMGKKIHIGYYKDEISAAKAYNDAAVKYYGEFASLNEV